MFDHSREEFYEDYTVSSLDLIVNQREIQNPAIAGQSNHAIGN